MRSSWVWPTINLLMTLITSVIVFVAPATPFQPYIVMSFVCFCPGMACVRFLRFHDLAVELSLGVALSLSFASIVAGAFLYSKYWSPLDIVTILVLLTLTCSIAHLIMQLPIIGLGRQDRSDAVVKSETVAPATSTEVAGEQQKMTKENALQPQAGATNPTCKAAWELERAATTMIPALAQSPTRQIVVEEDTILDTRSLPGPAIGTMIQGKR